MNKYIVIGIVFLAVGTIQGASKEKEVNSKEKLGELLFFDSILSKDRTISCASCHRPGAAFADTLALSRGVDGKLGSRNTPTVMNLLLAKSFFWDGRAASLEEQVLAPISNPDEMNLPIREAIRRLQKDKEYRILFEKVFNSAPTKQYLAEAIAAFERTLETNDSPFDNWKFTNDSSAVSASVRRGFLLFNGKGNCVKCHFGSDFRLNEFRNIGLFDGRLLNDSGRIKITGRKEDLGRFKIPSLRNIALTAPYMHNGMFKSIDDVIDFYDDPKKIVPDAINTDSLLLKPLALTNGEKQDLKEFMMALTDKRFKNSEYHE